MSVPELLQVVAKTGLDWNCFTWLRSRPLSGVLNGGTSPQSFLRDARQS